MVQTLKSHLCLNVTVLDIKPSGFLTIKCDFIFKIVFGSIVFSSCLLVKLCRHSVIPCPPGYMQRKARPSSSAWTLPAGVSSPPHFSTSSRDGPSFSASAKGTERTNVIQQQCYIYLNAYNKHTYLPPHWMLWAAHLGGKSAAPSCWSQRNGHTWKTIHGARDINIPAPLNKHSPTEQHRQHTSNITLSSNR